MNQTDILGSRGVWSATPANYSSMRVLWLNPDGSGQVFYGYGQTIYAIIRCHWLVPSPNLLRLTYLNSPSNNLSFKGYSPAESGGTRDISFVLTEVETTGGDQLGQPYRFLWKLELDEQPWPLDFLLPHEPPRVFFGHRQKT